MRREWKRSKKGAKAQVRVVPPEQMDRAFRGINTSFDRAMLGNAASLRKGNSGRRKGDPRRRG